MTDFIPPSDPGDPGPDGRENDPHECSILPTSNWGQAPRPADWRPDDTGGPDYGQPRGHQVSPNQDPYDVYGAGSYKAGYIRSSQATTALILVVLGLFCCGIPSIVGTIMAKIDLNAIRRGETDPENRGTAQAGFILGIIASTLWLAVAGLWLLAVLLSFAGGS